jgi:hypothetical protein
MQLAIEHGFVADHGRKVFATGESDGLAAAEALSIAFGFEPLKPGALFVGLALQGADNRGERDSELRGPFLGFPAVAPDPIGLDDIAHRLLALASLLRCEFRVRFVQQLGQAKIELQMSFRFR